MGNKSVEITEIFTKLEISAKKLNEIKPSELREYLDTINAELAIFCDSVENSTSQDLQFMRLQLVNANNETTKQYNSFVEKLTSTALRDEKNKMFSAMIYACRSLMETIKYIDDNVETLFNDKNITLYNTRVSQVGIIGIMHYAAITAMFVNYLFSNINACVVKGLTIYPYRTVYITKNSDVVSTVVNDVYRRTGIFSYLNGIGELKKRNLDEFILTDDGKSNADNLPYDSIPIPIKSTFIAGLFGLNIFRWIGETWNLFRHSKFIKMQAEREWMSSHVDVLKMTAARVDPDSAEYQKKIAIIKKYDEMIARLDAKLGKYFKED